MCSDCKKIDSDPSKTYKTNLQIKLELVIFQGESGKKVDKVEVLESVVSYVRDKKRKGEWGIHTCFHSYTESEVMFWIINESQKITDAHKIITALHQP